MTYEQLGLWTPIPPAPKRWFLYGAEQPGGLGLILSTGIQTMTTEPIYHSGRDYNYGRICTREPDSLIGMRFEFRADVARDGEPANCIYAIADAMRRVLAQEENLGLRELLRELVNDDSDSDR